MTAPSSTGVCDVCGALLAQRAAAKEAGRDGEVGDCERELREALDERTGVHTATVRPYDISRPPVPVDGCAPCAELAARRAEARAVFDYSAVGDANVLLRTHQRLDHGS